MATKAAQGAQIRTVASSSLQMASSPPAAAINKHLRDHTPLAVLGSPRLHRVVCPFLHWQAFAKAARKMRIT